MTQSTFNVLKSGHRLFSSGRCQSALQPEYDVVVIGAGHNGLVAAGYLQRCGLNVCVLERRHVVGGAAVTEEIVPSFKFSRASYVLSLLRPKIINDLQLKKFGLKVHLRNPSSFTPLSQKYWKNNTSKSLILGQDDAFNFQQISLFSVKDAKAYELYEKQLQRIVKALDPLLDLSPASVIRLLSEQSLWKRVATLLKDRGIAHAGISIAKLGAELPTAWQLLMAPIREILDQWFESEPLRATLATDALIGAMHDTNAPGGGYVLLHHVMGELEGKRGAWGYPEGGMGAVTQALADSAASHGAHIFTNQTVEEILLDANGKVTGVLNTDGQEIKASLVLSNATPKITFLNLLPNGTLPDEFQSAVKKIDYTSPVTKINVAISRLPDFLSDPCAAPGRAMPHHQATIHLNCEDMRLLDEAYDCAKRGTVSDKPMIEMVLPSVLDRTLAPEGAHVCLLFTQFTPYHVPGGWSEAAKEAYATKVFDCIEEYAPGFKASVVGKEVLPPPDLERVFGLTGGNIFHGGMSLPQLFLCRPVAAAACQSPYTPVPGLLLCGAGAHPGGGVMGAPGYLAAQAARQVLAQAKAATGSRRG
ncbi:Pyridine nucleotide-disulfide oxidoreductase domain-containing protein 2 [Frankliniella fusca]|uniref:Pyridine nucleotide-disulfide oxidoreductase domain-containing protein 2 n=1 Tax=Frankliniella fusca TaxID=407009 RepID=A0AAE1H5D4_9NEOP|nr:Pyridine nucleotide-disulfide oxidoreductase domain-containing protein 2 [Frankliniella fusca]